MIEIVCEDRYDLVPDSLDARRATSAIGSPIPVALHSVAGQGPWIATLPVAAGSMPAGWRDDPTITAVSLTGLDRCLLAGKALHPLVGAIHAAGKVIALALPQELLAAAIPVVARFQEADFVLERTGNPRFLDAHGSERDALESQWLDDLAKLAAYSNVAIELGGLSAGAATTSDALFDRWASVLQNALEIFGSDRAMFATLADLPGTEVTIWNAYVKSMLGLDSREMAAVFGETASQTYGL